MWYLFQNNVKYNIGTYLLTKKQHVGMAADLSWNKLFCFYLNQISIDQN